MALYRVSLFQILLSGEGEVEKCNDNFQMLGYNFYFKLIQLYWLHYSRQQNKVNPGLRSFTHKFLLIDLYGRLKPDYCY